MPSPERVETTSMLTEEVGRGRVTRKGDNSFFSPNYSWDFGMID